MCPGLGVDLALRPLLDPVVADRRGRITRLFELRLADRLQVSLFGVIQEHARVAVGLQFGPDGARLGAGVTATATEDAGQVLHMVSVLVG